MSPGTFDNKDWEKSLKGHVKIGGIHIAWDFTHLIEQRRIDDAQDIYLTKSGRIIMPNLSIL